MQILILVFCSWRFFLMEVLYTRWLTLPMVLIRETAFLFFALM